MKKYPVTNRDYLCFLNDLFLRGERYKAVSHSPRFRGSQREMAYGLDESKESPFFLKPDTEGDIWDLDWPVILIRPLDAMEYAEWYSQKTDVAWNLPTVEQWEKSVRGADGRKYPWGNYCEPTWACFRGSKKGELLPSHIHDFETDKSVYGICGLAGNVQDFCTSSDSNDTVLLMGGAWSYYPDSLSLSRQRVAKKDEHTEVYGFRLVHNVG
jgi:serine/threonine-protein kinase